MTRLMSLLMMPSRPMNSAVLAPMISTSDSAVCDSSNSGDILATMKMPAVTIVAAWMSAEIGVGPSIESGSQTCSGICADLPIAPINRHTQMSVIAEPGWAETNGTLLARIVGAAANTV